MKRSLFFASLAVSASLVLAVAPVAAASEGEDLGEQFSQMIPDVTAPEDRVPLDSAAQQQLAEALVTVSKLPGVTAAEKLDIRRDIALLNKVNPVLADETQATVVRAERLAQSGGPVSTTQAVPTLRMLGVTHQAQSNGWFCGPATASMIVRFKGKTHSQATLAVPAFLNTTSSEGTRWASGRMASTLNLVLGKKIYQQVQSPSAAALKGAFINSINASNPLAVSTVEFQGAANEVRDTHYNGHPNATIGHWIVGRGHNDSGASLLFMDPATSVFPNAAKSFTLSTSKFQKFVATNGVVW